jgi:hypothetical protein
MSIPKQQYTVPSCPTAQRKADIIDREGLEDVRCDLEYAPRVRLPEHPVRTIVTTSVVVAIASTALTWAAGRYVLPIVFYGVPPSYAFAVVLVLAVVAGIDCTKTLEENLIRIFRNGLLGAWFFVAIAPIPLLLHPGVALLWLLIVALPIAVYFAYRFTTLSVHRITAHPLGDGLTMLRCRDIWEHRHEGVRMSVPEEIQKDARDAARWTTMLHAVRSHDYGPVWIYMAILAGLAMARFTCSERHFGTLGIQATVAILMALLTAALLRCEGRLPIGLLGRMLLHWFHYDANRQSTPWMLQSPCGDAVARQRWAWTTVGVMAVAINNLASGYLHFTTPVARMVGIIRPEITQPCLALLITVVCCVAVPMAVLGLVFSIIAGPALKAFDELYSTH